MVLLAAFGASGAPVGVKLQAVPIFGHPANLTRWVTDHKRIGGYVFGDHRAGANKGVGADVVAADDSGVGANAGSLTYVRAQIAVAAVHGTAWVNDVGKHHGGAQEDVVGANNTRVDTHVVLNLHVVAEHDIWANDHVLANIAGFPEGTAWHEVRKVPNFAAFSDVAAFVNYRGFVGKVVHYLVMYWSKLLWSVWRSSSSDRLLKYA